jgi:hypothetical protein
MQLLVDVDLSAMADCCSVALAFSGVTHGDSDGKPTSSTSNGINGKRNRAKDGLSGVTHGTVKPSVVPKLVRNASHQDDVVAPELTSVALLIGMATVKPTKASTVMV